MPLFLASTASNIDAIDSSFACLINPHVFNMSRSTLVEAFSSISKSTLFPFASICLAIRSESTLFFEHPNVLITIVFFIFLLLKIKHIVITKLMKPLHNLFHVRQVEAIAVVVGNHLFKKTL